ncbi:hypothetical protein [Crateriforma conspicua]|nr:hypothetical protein [Crateriforma conspicua]
MQRAKTADSPRSGAVTYQKWTSAAKIQRLRHLALVPNNLRQR